MSPVRVRSVALTENPYRRRFPRPRLYVVTLEELRELLAHATTVAYVLLAAVSILQWRRHRSQPAAWLALTFLVIGSVVLLGEFLPEPPETSPLIEAIRRINLAALLLF